ncbi:DNA cytosine methyltransferase, partial [Thiolapillus sp.]
MGDEGRGTIGMKKQNGGVSCVDLFCGAGGLTHGFILEGLPVNAGIDLDPACRYPYEKNNGAVFIERDIARMESDEVAELFTSGTTRVLAGCAPCQPFSTYSQRYDTRSDGKWGLLYEFGRLARDIRPDIVTMENVPTVERHGVFKDFASELEGLGYQVWSDVVQCAQYGVPQRRRRMVLLASLHGPIRMIEPTHSKPRTVEQ